MNKYVFSFWAIADFLTLIIYFALQFYYGKIPFYSDYIMNSQIASNKIFSSVMLISSIILFLSLPFSIYYFSKNNTYVKWWVLGQMPLRLFAATSSVPLLFGLIGHIVPLNVQISLFYPITLAILFVIIEGYKLFSVLKKL